MKLFIHTANIDEIREANTWEIVDGVTTNPTRIFETGRPAHEVYEELCHTVRGPVCLEAVGLETDDLVREGRELAKIANNVVVRVPITRDGLVAVRRLADDGIATSVATIFSAMQALLAAKCGATYVSPFIGQLDEIGHVGIEIVERIRAIYDNYGFPTQVLVTGVRSSLHVQDAALAAADCCAMSFDVMKQLYEHPLTDIGVKRSLQDWKKIPQPPH
jgi:transaldolase